MYYLTANPDIEARVLKHRHKPDVVEYDRYRNGHIEKRGLLLATKLFHDIYKRKFRRR